MTLEKSLKISMTSDASEADLYIHMQEMIDYIKDMRLDEWRSNIHISWETSLPVEIEVTEEKT